MDALILSGSAARSRLYASNYPFWKSPLTQDDSDQCAFVLIYESLRHIKRSICLIFREKKCLLSLALPPYNKEFLRKKCLLRIISKKENLFCS